MIPGSCGRLRSQAFLTQAETKTRAKTAIDDSGPTARYGLVAVSAAFVLALATFVVFAGMTPILPTANVVEALLLGDGLVVIVVSCS